jgi:hypothetical protein
MFATTSVLSFESQAYSILADYNCNNAEPADVFHQSHTSITVMAKSGVLVNFCDISSA